MTLTMVAMSAASAFVQASATTRASNQQADYTRSAYAANDAAAQLQQVQIGEQSSAQMSERARQAMVERGHLRAIAAESGTEGNNIQRLGVGIDQAEGQDLATLEANRTNSIQQVQRSKEAGQRSAANSIAALPEPSLLGAGLQIAGSAVGQMRPTSRMPSIYSPGT